ncbi:MAG: hypothetical protein ACOZAP_10070 [Pseudomonadota bacterium]
MNIKLVLLGVPLMALTGCAGSGYVHETYYGDGYYGPPPYPGTVYVHRETYYEPRPRVVVVEEPRIVVVRPPAPDHGHVDPRRMEERHEHRHEVAAPREVAAKPLWRGRESGAGLEQAPRKDASARRGAQDNAQRENHQTSEEGRPR